MNFLKGLIIAGLLVTTSACSIFDSDEEQNVPAALIDFEKERSFDKVWSRNIGNGQGKIYNRLVPAINGESIIAAAADGTVARLNLENGKEIWTVNLENTILGGVGVGKSTILLGTISGDVLVLDLQTGEKLWSVNVGGEVLSAPQAKNDLIFVQTVDGKILALNDKDGQQIWAFTNSVPVLTLRGTSTPLLFRDSVIAGFANGNVISFNQQTGTVQWTVRVSVAKGNSEIDRMVDVDGNLLLTNNLLYATSYQGRVTAIDPNAGTRIWSNEASSNSGMSSGFGNIYVTGDDGTITAFEKSGNGVRWAQTVLANRELSGTVTQGSYVITGDFEGYLHALSQVDGRIAARTKLGGGGIRADLLIAGNRIIAYANNGTLAVYRLE